MRNELGKEQEQQTRTCNTELKKLNVFCPQEQNTTIQPPPPLAMLVSLSLLARLPELRALCEWLDGGGASVVAWPSAIKEYVANGD